MKELSQKGKKAVKISLIVIASMLVLCILGIAIYSLVAFAPLRLNIDLAEEKQTISGFGASSAWIYQDLGKAEHEEQADEALEMLYGDSGLELSIFRYNIGGGSADASLDDVWPYNNPGFDKLRRAESFFVAENYSEPSDFLDESNYDFERDAAVRGMFEKALALGNIEKVVFFSNSPHYLMTHSGVCTGSEEYQNNLKEEFYEEYSWYLLIITNHLYETYLKDLPAVPEVWISPVNEPQWKWGGEGSSQEGCHYDPEVLAAFYEVFYEQLQKFNAEKGTSFKLDAFESGNYLYYLDYDIRDYLDEMSKYDYFAELDEISVHAYGANDSKYDRKRFARFMDKNYPELKISSSEFCEMEWGEFNTIESGMFLAKVILRDLTMIDAVEWSWWLSVAKGGYNDGLVYWNEESGDVYVLKRYYTFAQISKFLNSGDKRVEAKLSDTAGWAGVDAGVFVKPDGSVVAIFINDGKEKSLKLNGLDAFVGSTAQVTFTTQAENLAEDSFTFEGGITLRENSVTTLVLQ